MNYVLNQAGLHAFIVQFSAGQHVSDAFIKAAFANAQGPILMVFTMANSYALCHTTVIGGTK